MQHSRRVFLRALGAGVAFVSLPEVSSIFNLFPSGHATDDDLAATLRRLFLNEEAGGGPFVAHAETFVIESSPQQLLGSPRALISILDQLGVDRSFSNRMGRADAAQCRGNFERQEAAWRGGGGLGPNSVYTDVQRARADRDVAIAVGAIVNPASGRFTRAEGAVQFQARPAVRLSGDGPGAIEVAPTVVREHIQLSPADIAKAFAVTEHRPVEVGSGQSAHRYETPVSSVIHIPRPRAGNRVGDRAVGVVAVNHKSDPNKIYFADVYS